MDFNVQRMLFIDLVSDSILQSLINCYLLSFCVASKKIYTFLKGCLYTLSFSVADLCEARFSSILNKITEQIEYRYRDENPAVPLC